MRESQVQLETSAGVLDATWLNPVHPRALFVFSHGAGAGHRHGTMEGIAEHLGNQEIATLRFNFPFMQAGKRHVDKPAVATRTIAEVTEFARANSDTPIFLCGHSFGGRMNSHTVVDEGLECAGLIFCSFPLHPAKKPGVKRAEHLVKVQQPMLFLSGTRDDLADRALLTQVVDELEQARLHWLDTANHSYVILKRTRQNPMPVFEEIALEARAFVDEVI